MGFMFCDFSKITLRRGYKFDNLNWLCMTSVLAGDTSDSRKFSHKNRGEWGFNPRMYRAN